MSNILRKNSKLLTLVVFVYVVIFVINTNTIGMPKDRFTILTQDETLQEEDKEFYKKANFRFIAKMGDYPIYIDKHTNIFTYENKENPNKFNLDKLIFMGRISKEYLTVEPLNDLDYYTDSYFYDEKNELFYFIDWSEKNENGQYNYSSFCVINNKLEKIKLFETTPVKIENDTANYRNFYKILNKFLFINGDIVLEYNGTNNISVVKDIANKVANTQDLDFSKDSILGITEEKLDIANSSLYIYGKNGDIFCYIGNLLSGTWYKYEYGNITKIAKPKEIKY